MCGYIPFPAASHSGGAATDTRSIPMQLPASAVPIKPPVPPRQSFWEKLTGGQLRALVPRLRPHTRVLALATVTMIVGTAMGLAFPLAVGDRKSVV